MKEAKASLLIIEDDLDIAEMLDAYFRMQGYETSVANWGEDGVSTCMSHPPDLVILDIRLPDIDGFEVATRLRSNRRTQNIPIIFLTEKRERSDRLKGLSLKAEDYITKPFDVQELRLRVTNALDRNRRNTLTNPITGLPEGNLVDEHLEDYLVSTDLCISVISLKNLSRFREVYGFVASDDVLRAVALMIKEALRTQGSSGDFLGHLDPTAFLMITRPANLLGLKDQIRKRLAPSLDYFYRDQDRDTELFQGHHLSVEIYDYSPKTGMISDVKSLKMELEKLSR